MPTYLHGLEQVGKGTVGVGGKWRHATPQSCRAQLEAGNGRQLAAGSRLVWSLPKWQKLTVAYAKWSLTRLGVNAWRQQHSGQGETRRDEARWGRRMRGCPAINRHKNKLQLPSMNKFHCNLLCIPFFSPWLHICLPPQQHLPHGWPPKRHLKFSFINRSQSGAAFLCVLDLVGARVGVGVGVGVGLFGFSFHFVSIFHSVSLRVSNVVLLPFVRIYCLYHSDSGRGCGSSIHKLSVCVCVCGALCKVYRSRNHLCVLSEFSWLVYDFLWHSCSRHNHTHTALYTLDISQEIIVFGFTLWIFALNKRQLRMRF